MVCLKFNRLFYDTSIILQLYELLWKLCSSVYIDFKNFLLIGATDRSRINSDQKRSFTPFHFSRTLSLNRDNSIKILNFNKCAAGKLNWSLSSFFKFSGWRLRLLLMTLFIWDPKMKFYPKLKLMPATYIKHLRKVYHPQILEKQGIWIKGREMALVFHEKASRTALQTSSVSHTHTLLVQTHNMTTVQEIFFSVLASKT